MDHVADYPKLASSAAHLYGKPRAFTESFAAFTHKPSVSQAKWVLDYQMARGINSVQVMFMSASTPRSALSPSAATPRRPASEAVPSLSFFMTDTFPPVAQYINRAAYLLSQGRPAASIGLYFPSMSMWYGDNESNTSALDIARQLMENQRDFDFVDEQALISLLKSENGAFRNLSGQFYRTIIVPSISVISGASLSKLKEFASSGGKVIVVGNLPSLAVEKNFMNAVKPAELSWAYHEGSGKLTASSFELLPPPDLKIDKTLPQVKYVHREWKDADLYFIFNEVKEPVFFNVYFSLKGNKQIWDAASGKISAFKGSSLSLGPWETKFILIKK
jgi:hypothetical protein